MTGKVKVIKREDRDRQAQKPAKAVAPKNPAREMVATVSNWVNEFQQKRRTQTKQAFNQLFVDKTRPNTV